jgi:hypothetical protein
MDVEAISGNGTTEYASLIACRQSYSCEQLAKPDGGSQWSADVRGLNPREQYPCIERGGSLGPRLWVADGLWKVITTPGGHMGTSVSSFEDAFRETLNAVDEIRRHDRLLTPAWRDLVEAVQRRVKRNAACPRDIHSLRMDRAAAATAAGEAAQSARFAAQLLRLAPEELATARRELQLCITTLRHAEGDAKDRLNDAIEAVLGQVRTESRIDQAPHTGAVTRRQARHVEDIVTAMRGYGERIEQILLDLGDVARTTFGAAMGGGLRVRVSYEPPRPDLDRIATSDAARDPIEWTDAIWRSVELYRGGLAELIDEAVNGLEIRLDEAAERQGPGEPRVGERIGELMLDAKQLDELAQRLEWILPATAGSSCSGRSVMLPPDPEP